MMLLSLTDVYLPLQKSHQPNRGTLVLPTIRTSLGQLLRNQNHVVMN